MSSGAKFTKLSSGCRSKAATLFIIASELHRPLGLSSSLPPFPIHALAASGRIPRIPSLSKLFCCYYEAQDLEPKAENCAFEMFCGLKKTHEPWTQLLFTK